MNKFADFNIHAEGESGQVRTTCPNCTSSRSPKNQNEKDLSVNIDEGIWLCHHCGWSGSLNGKERHYKPIQYKPNMPENVVKAFEKKRKISAKTLSEHNVGWIEPKGKIPGALSFPRMINGNVYGIKYRSASKQMWQSKDPMPCFYNYDNALKSGEKVLVITEGEIDSMSWHEAGIRNNASVPNGAPSPNSKNLDKCFEFLEDGLVKHFDQFILATDNDEPGQLLAEELANRLGAHNCLLVKYPSGCKDANDVLVQYGVQALQQVYAQAKPMPIDGLYQPADLIEHVMDLYNEGLKPGLSTGYNLLDDFYTVRESEMTIITGIPGSGKSTWLDALSVNLFRDHGWKFAFCSPENWPVHRHVASIVEKLTKKPFNKAHPESIGPEELQTALDVIQDSFFFTQLQSEKMSIDYILDVMQAAISRHGVNGIILDPWNELEQNRPEGITETEYISTALGKIRRFARLNGVHIWIVAHPTKLQKNNDGTYPVPRLYDVAGSAHFYNKTDNGICIYRKDLEAPVEVHVQKVRFKEVGRPGSIYMGFNRESGTYYEINPNYEDFT